MAKKRQVDDIIDIRFFIFKLINNWYLFLISILLFLAVAFGINRYSQEIYETSTTLLINSKGKIHKILSNVRVKDHAKEVLSELKKI